MHVPIVGPTDRGRVYHGNVVERKKTNKKQMVKIDRGLHVSAQCFQVLATPYMATNAYSPKNVIRYKQYKMPLL